MIRRLVADDLPILSSLYKQFWNEDSNVDAMREQFNHMGLDGNYILLGAIEDDILVGSIMGILCRDLYGNCQPFMILENFIVDKSFRKKGIGKALMAEIEKIASEYNCNYTMLITDTRRTDARAFYKSVGYNPDTHIGLKKKLNGTVRSIPEE